MTNLVNSDIQPSQMATLRSSELEIRDRDTIFGSQDLETLFEIPNYPVYMGCTHKNKEEDIFATQSWQISKSTGVLQLKYLVPLDLVYLEQHNDSFGKTWDEHHQRFSYLVTSSGASKVLEIGGATGRLASYIDIQEIKWEIIEPNSSRIPGILIHDSFFDDRFANIHANEYEAIVHSHCFEHMYDPLRFLGNCRKALRSNGKMIFSVPNMHEMLKRKYTNCINFEHTFFLPEQLVDYLLEVSKFKILDKQYYKSDHSIFYTCAKQSLPNGAERPTTETSTFNAELYHLSKRLFNGYIAYHQNLIEALNRHLTSIPEDTPVYLFGAHVFSQFLIFNGLSTSKIICILDNSPLKVGKRLYGTSLHVDNPNRIAGDKNPVVILKAGSYNDEIKSDILKNINMNTHFL